MPPAAACAASALRAGDGAAPPVCSSRAAMAWSLSALRLLRNPADQLAERDAEIAGLFGYQGQRGHAWLRIHFQQIKPARIVLTVVVAEIGARDAPTTKHLVRNQRA